MPSLASLTTFSGLLVLFGVLAILWSRPLVAGVLFTIAGAGGTAIFWDRWSRLSGHDVHLTALSSAATPAPGDLTLLATHFPILVVGAAIILHHHARGRE
jgi:hypothetical protein